MYQTLALIAAAGLSRRTGGLNKLATCNREGTPLLLKTLSELLKSQASHIQLILPAETRRYQELRCLLPPQSTRLSYKQAPPLHHSLTNTLQCGIKTAIACHYDNLLITLGDMPWVPAQHYSRMIEIKDTYSYLIVATAYQGRCHPPIIWDRKLFKTLQHMTSSRARRHFLREQPPNVLKQLPCPPHLLRDYDTIEALNHFKHAYPR